MKHNILVIAIIFLLCVGCNRNSTDDLAEIFGKKIILPANARFTCNAADTVDMPIGDGYKIVCYIDSFGCISCRLNLAEWTDYMDQLNSLVPDSVPLLIYLHPSKLRDARNAIRKADYTRPICIDMNDEFGKANQQLLRHKIHTFLVDENYNVVLFGNPLSNSEIRELYIKTIVDNTIG